MHLAPRGGFVLRNKNPLRCEWSLRWLHPSYRMTTPPTHQRADRPHQRLASEYDRPREAPDEDTAIEQAIEKFKIDPRLAEKLIAEKTKTQAHRKG
jgi:hypothetical protein